MTQMVDVTASASPASIASPPASSEENAVACHLCGSTRRRAMLRDVKRYAGCRPWRCHECGLVYFVFDRGSQDADGESRYWEDDANLAIYQDPSVQTDYAAKYGAYLDRLKALVPGRRLLEVGCGVGMFIELAHQAGFECHGLDISPRVIEVAARRNPNATWSTGTLDTVPYPERCFDVIAMWDVIEHVSAPQDLARLAFNKLRPNGVLIVETPNERNLFRRGFLHLDNLTNGRLPLASYGYYPAHRYLFAPHTMRRLLTQSGFEDIDIRAESSFTHKATKKFAANRPPYWHLAAGLLPWGFALARAIGQRNKMVVIARRPTE